MNITRENYEVYAVSYLEGEMTPSQVEKFIKFLINNPDIADEIDSMRDFIKNDYYVEQSTFDARFLKHDLNKQEVTIENVEEFCIAWYEGDLTSEGSENLTRFLNKNQSYTDIFEAYSRVYLEADNNIYYKTKKDLKHSTYSGSSPLRKRVVRIGVITSFAATLLLLIILVFNPIHSSISTLYLSNHSAQKSASLYKNIMMKDLYTAEMDVTIPDNNLISEPQTMVALRDRGSNIIKDSKIADSINFKEEINFVKLDAIQPQPIISGIIAELVAPDRIYSKPVLIDDSENLLANLKVKSENFLLGVKNINVDRILQKSVNGINQMTESTLVYQSEKDEDGNIIAYSIASENINIKRVRRN